MDKVKCSDPEYCTDERCDIQGEKDCDGMVEGKMDKEEIMERLRNEVKTAEEYQLTTLAEDIKFLLSEVDRLEARGKALEEDIPDPEWCCTNHKKRLVARIKELEEGIRNFPWGAYGEAFREGCDANGAWDCFYEEANKHLYKLLEGKL